jgi:HK97 family phage major capsid protein
MNTKELRRQRAALIEQARSIMNEVPAGGNLSAEQNEKFERMMADADAMLRTIEAAERLSAAESDLEQGARSGQTNPSRRDGGQDAAPTASEEYRSAVNAWVRGGYDGLQPEQRELLSQFRAQSAVTGASGGYTVAQAFYNKLFDAMKTISSVQEAGATILSTTTGADMPIPTANDTAQTGELIGENTAVNGQDIGFGQVILKAYKYSSKTVLVPFELLQDAAFDIEAYIASKLGDRLGRITNTHFTTGDNSSKPQGIVPFSTLGKTGAAGQTTSLIYDDLVDLEHALDPAYRYSGKAKFMFHDSTLKAIKKLKDSQGRPLWLPGLQVREPDTILGYAYKVNQDMVSMAASAKSILFGDMSNYVIRVVKDIALYRIADKYIESGQVGFLAFWRGDGRGVDAGTHPIVYYANPAS